MIREGIYGLNYVLQHVQSNTKKEFNGHMVKMGSQRYILFKAKGITCANCGIQGKYFALERHPWNESYHFNLYALDEQGNEILMTKDHIIPKSKGGKNIMFNYQTMCTKCNSKKGNTQKEEENKCGDCKMIKELHCQDSNKEDSACDEFKRIK